MPFHVGVGGAWKEASKAYVGVGGAWKEVQGMWVGVGGAWKQFYQNLTVTLAGGTFQHTTISPTNAISGVVIDSDGYVYRRNGGNYVQLALWLVSGAAADCECRWTTTSGGLTTGTAGAWLNCGTDREFNVITTTNGFDSNSCAGTLEIRMAAAPNTVLASASYSLTASVEI